MYLWRLVLDPIRLVSTISSFLSVKNLWWVLLRYKYSNGYIVSCSGDVQKKFSCYRNFEFQPVSLSFINCRSAGACVLASRPCRNRWAVTEHYFQISTPCSPQAVQHTGRSSQKGKGSIYHKDTLVWSGRRKCPWCIMICYAWMFSVEENYSLRKNYHYCNRELVHLHLLELKQNSQCLCQHGLCRCVEAVFVSTWGQLALS